MNERKLGRRWFLFWSLMATVLLALPAMSGWIGSARSSEEMAQPKSVKAPSLLPAPVDALVFAAAPTVERTVNEVSEVDAAEKSDEAEAAAPVRKEERTEIRVNVEAVTPSKYWIGVLARPVENQLVKSQLGIQEGLVVERVVPDSPADQAGLEEQDILIKVGDRSLDNLRTLVDCIEDSQTNEMQVTFIRHAKQQSVKLTPAERPQTSQQDGDQLAAARDRILKALAPSVTITRKKGAENKKEATEFVVVMPGVLLPDQEKAFPEDLEITMTKKGKEKADIKVKMGEKVWSVDEATLDELPEGVREHVKQFLNRGAHAPHAWSTGELRFDSSQFDFSKLPGISAEGLKGIPAEELKRWFKVTPGTQFDLQKIVPGAKSRIVLRSEVKRKSGSDADEETIEVTIDSHLGELEKAIGELEKQLLRLRQLKAESSEKEAESQLDMNVKAIEEAIESLRKANEAMQQGEDTTAPADDDSGAWITRYALACV